MLAGSLLAVTWSGAVRQALTQHAAHLAVLALAGTLFFVQLHERELWPSHEARAAQEAQQFLTTKSWGVHHLMDGSNDYQKPPLFYWLVASVAWLRGGNVDAMALRLPAAGAGWITVWAVMAFLRRRHRLQAAWLAGLTLATAGHFAAIARTGRIDVPLTAAVTLSVLAQLEGRWIIGGLCVGLAILLKGPIGLVLPVLVVTSVFLASRGLAQIVSRRLGHTLSSLCVLRVFVPLGLKRQTTKTRRHEDDTKKIKHQRILCEGASQTLSQHWTNIVKAALLGFMIAAPWFVYAGWETNWEYWRVFFWHHNVARATGTAADLARHPAWYYLMRWLMDWLPWSPLLVMAFVSCLRWRHWRSDREMAIGMIWMLAVTVLLTFSRFKRADYLIPAYPGAAILLGCWIDRRYQTLALIWQRRASWGLTTLVVGTLGAFLTIDQWPLAQEKLIYPQSTFAKLIRRHAPTDRPIVFLRIEDHLLAYHLRPPLISVNEWENLDVWIRRIGEGCVIMPVHEARQWSSRVLAGKLQEVARMTGEGDSPRQWVALRFQKTDPRNIDEP